MPIEPFDLLFVFSHSPYGSSLGREGLEAALAAGAFDQNMAILFMGEGVWQLKDQQNSLPSERKNHQKMASALPLFGIDTLFVQNSALATRKLSSDQLYLNAHPLEDNQTRELISQAKHVLSF